MTACNSLHDFLNLKIFSKYGTILLVFILVVIIANLMEYDLGLKPYAYKVHNSLGFRDTVEGFTTPPPEYAFPDLYYLKYDNDYGVAGGEKYLYVNPKSQYSTTNLLASDAKSNPYRVFNNSSNDTIVRMPILVNEYLDILTTGDVTLDRKQQAELANNQFVEYKIVKTDSTSSLNKNATFNLALVNPDIKLDTSGTVTTDGNKRLFLTLQDGNVIGLKLEDHVDIANKGTFKLESKADAEGKRFQPIIPNSMKLKIHPNKNEIDVMFNVDPSETDVDHFLIVLAKYDYKRNLVGHLKVHTSVESGASKKNICYMDAGVRKCSYSLTDIDHIDSDGNILYYRVSVIPVDKSGVSGNYVEPTYPGGYSHFLMSKSEKEMDKIIKKVKEMEHTEKQRERLHEEIVSSAGGEYEFLKKQLGNYPDHLILDTNKHSLNDLVNKSMALGEINLDMSMS